MPTIFGQVVFVTAADFFDQTMCSQTFNDCGYLSGCFLRQFESQIFVLKTADIKFSAGNGLKYSLVIVGK